VADAPRRHDMASAALIALDWGTTSLRAWLLDEAGQVLDRQQSREGILSVPAGGFIAVFEAILSPWRTNSDPLPAIACGMVGSRQGWREAPYAPCPCAAVDLQHKLARVAAGASDLVIVPGVAFDPGGQPPDVMRGEETQVFGALAGSELSATFVLPGTHSKWVTAEQGRITRFATYMTGEVFDVLRRHSILGRTMSDGVVRPDNASFIDGVEAGLNGGSGLLHRLFEVRSLALFDRLSALDGQSYLSGLLIGSEIAGARETATGDHPPVTLIGAPDLVAAYRTALHIAGIAAEVADLEVTPQGLWRIAVAAGMIGR